MSVNQASSITIRERVGWIILLLLAVVLVLHGLFWFRGGATTMMGEIVERTSLTPADFQTGSSPAMSVLAIVNGNYAVFEAGIGLMGLLLAWRGLRGDGRAVRAFAWVFVLAEIGIAANFTLVAGIYAASIIYLVADALAVLGLLLARPAAAGPLPA